MRYLLGLLGVCLMGSSGLWYFVCWQAGVCSFMFLAGTGLFIDSLRK